MTTEEEKIPELCEDTWEVRVQACKNSGYPSFTPNGLPIRCIKADGTMWEHEHGDHKDYKFPVIAEYVGDVKEDHQWCCVDDDGNEYMKQMTDNEIWCDNHEEHALIYTDGCLAVTLYECCYAFWYLHENGQCCGGSLWEPWERKSTKGWKLTQESIKKILDYYEDTKNNANNHTV